MLFIQFVMSKIFLSPATTMYFYQLTKFEAAYRQYKPINSTTKPHLILFLQLKVSTNITHSITFNLMFLPAFI